MVKDPLAAVNGDLSTDAFEDYNPQTIIMPRIAFSFPISDEAHSSLHIMMCLHKDPQVVVQRMELIEVGFNPIQYLFFTAILLED